MGIVQDAMIRANEAVAMPVNSALKRFNGVVLESHHEAWLRVDRASMAPSSPAMNPISYRAPTGARLDVVMPTTSRVARRGQASPTPMIRIHATGLRKAMAVSHAIVALSIMFLD